jgi:hypothetical protein
MRQVLGWVASRVRHYEERMRLGDRPEVRKGVGKVLVGNEGEVKKMQDDLARERPYRM